MDHFSEKYQFSIQNLYIIYPLIFHGATSYWSCLLSCRSLKRHTRYFFFYTPHKLQGLFLRFILPYHSFGLGFFSCLKSLQCFHLFNKSHLFPTKNQKQTNMDNNQATKAEAKMQQTAGDVQETVGSAVGNEQMQAEGQARRGEGQVDEMSANVDSFFKGIKEKTEGAWKGLVHSITGK
ncbi:hypothetical protein BDA99DRAFT_523565 [Phascolomyces articulosus]|uniref:CsbD-like domain-containing protein n=1 Tax=Phascolomyces articulosus TaxID=60185 RepID=A0AAD5K419_9FUNG|nr:hypothetical protein BDA99DRAFT_523565 [Phascolomyces articulosus]